jgi:2-iminobutanoate/2-iminopropanoate deaminase
LIDEKVVICQTKISIMSKKIIHTTAAPGAIGPYSQAIQTGNLLFVSGQIPINPATNELVMDNIQDETKQVMENLKAVLSAANVGFENIVKTTIFLSDMSLFAAVNEIYGSYFTGDYPARETVAVKGLPKGVNVEISAIAFI